MIDMKLNPDNCSSDVLTYEHPCNTCLKVTLMQKKVGTQVCAFRVLLLQFQAGDVLLPLNSFHMKQKVLN